MMNRRTFLCGLTLGTLSAPLAVEAQPTPGKTARIGYLSFRSGPSFREEAFRQGLRELGYVEGQDTSVEYRWADWKVERVPALAAELVRFKVDVIVTNVVPLLAVKKAIRTIPVVFMAGDVLRGGLVHSLDRPGGNLTGIAFQSTELNVK